MRMVDLIEKKRDGGILTDDEIRFIIQGFTDGSIPEMCIRDSSRASASWAGTYQAYSVSQPAVSSPPVPSAYRRRSVSPFGRHAAACAAGRSAAGVDVAV